MLVEIEALIFLCGGTELFSGRVCLHKTEKEEQERECYFKHEGHECKRIKVLL